MASPANGLAPPAAASGDVRLCDIGDIPFLTGLAIRAYGARIRDRGQLHRFVVAVCSRDHGLFVARTDTAAAICGIQQAFGGQPSELRLLYLASEGSVFAAMRLLRAAAEWGRQRGCSSFFLRDATDFDLGPLARRLSRRVRVSAGYEVDL